MSPESDHLELASRSLERDGYALLPGFIDRSLANALAEECRSRYAQHKLSPAAIGKGSRAQHTELVRGDRTEWFDPLALSVPQSAFWKRMHVLSRSLNTHLFLGLEEFETHYTVFPAGSSYQRHRDRFRDDDARVLSIVCYLNDDWQTSDGGALRLYPNAGAAAISANPPHHDIFPHSGSLIIFLSAELEHEVLHATRDRLSIAGWFRRRA